MRLTVRVPSLPEGIEIDPTRLEKALRWALAEGWDPDTVWQVNNVPILAQLEESVFQEGQGGLAELYEAVVKTLGLPTNADSLALLAKARAGKKPMPGQLGLDFETEHPRLDAGGTLEGYKPGEFVPKEDQPAEQNYNDAIQAAVKWNDMVSNIDAKVGMHQSGELPLTSDGLRDLLITLQAQSDLHEAGITSTVKDVPRWKANVRRSSDRLAGKIAELIEDQKLKEQKDKEAEGLTPEQKVRVQFETWNKNLKEFRQRLTDHLMGEEPMSATDLAGAMDYFQREFDHYQKELSEASIRPENKAWFTHSDDMRLSHLARWSRIAVNRYEEAIGDSVFFDRAEADLGWPELQEKGKIVSGRADTVAAYYNYLAGEVAENSDREDRDPEYRRFQDEGMDKKRVLLAEAKRLMSKATREKNKTAKFFREQKNTGTGYTRHQQAFDKENAPAASKFQWKDLTGRLQGSGFSNPMLQSHWDAIQDKHPIPGAPANFFYMGPTTPSAGPQQREAKRAAERLTRRVPGWLRDRIADNGGEYVLSVVPPSRLGFKSQEEYDAWIIPRDEARKKSNDPRHWDEVGGFYRHSDKKGYSQVGESGQRGTVDLELHEYGHMVDYLFNGGQAGKHGAVSASPEFMRIWKGLHPWLDNYMTKDGDAAELFAEGFAVWNESEENRKRFLAKETPEPIRRLGLFMQRFMATGTYADLEKALRLFVASGKACDSMNEGERRASGKVKENGADLRWDAGYTDDEEEERHEHFPTLFLKTPRKAEIGTDNG